MVRPTILGRLIPIALCTTLAIVALFFIAPGTEAGNRETRPPNVVVILVDDLGRADIGPPVTSTSDSPFNRAHIRTRQIDYPPTSSFPGPPGSVSQKRLASNTHHISSVYSSKASC